MKKLSLLTIILVLAMAVSVNAANLRWDASTGADGYTVYFDGFTYDAGNNTEVLDIDDTLNLHPATTYTFTVTAYNQVGESGHSNSCEYFTADIYRPPANSIPIRLERPAVLTIIIE